MHERFVDPYVDPQTGILRNLVGAVTLDELKNAEGEFVALRTIQLISELPFKVRGSLEDFRAIHRYLFQDIYDWAGNPRTVEIRKNEADSQFFLPSENIETGFVWAQNELDSDEALKGVAADVFPLRLAYHFDNYNFIHPFREGNGRVQRLFWTLLCHDAGYDLDWRSVTAEENDSASKLAAEQQDLSQLVAIFSRIASPCDPVTPLNSELVNPGHLE